MAEEGQAHAAGGRAPPAGRRRAEPAPAPPRSGSTGRAPRRTDAGRSAERPTASAADQPAPRPSRPSAAGPLGPPPAARRGLLPPAGRRLASTRTPSSTLLVKPKPRPPEQAGYAGRREDPDARAEPTDGRDPGPARRRDAGPPGAQHPVRGRGPRPDQRHLRGVLERRPADALGGLQSPAAGPPRADPRPPVRSRRGAARPLPDLHPWRRLGDRQPRHPRRLCRRLAQAGGHGRERRLPAGARAQVPGRPRGLPRRGALARSQGEGVGDRPDPPRDRRRQRRRQPGAGDPARPARRRASPSTPAF